MLNSTEIAGRLLSSEQQWMLALPRTSYPPAARSGDQPNKRQRWVFGTHGLAAVRREGPRFPNFRTAPQKIHCHTNLC